MAYEKGDLTKSLFGYTDNKPCLSQCIKINQTNKLQQFKKINSKKGKTKEDKVTTVDTYNNCLFVGNLPLDTNKKELLKLFKPYGEIVNLRFRSIPLLSKSTSSMANKNQGKTPILPPFTTELPFSVAAKVCNNNPEKTILCVHGTRSNKNAYINFKSANSVTDAIKNLHGHFFKGTNHLRLDVASKRKRETKQGIAHTKGVYSSMERTIFIGNLPMDDCEEEDIWDLFDRKLGLAVESVRILRQKDGLSGSGCGFVVFKDVDSVTLAVMKNEKIKVKGRIIRIKKCLKPTSHKLAKQRTTTAKPIKRKIKMGDKKKFASRHIQKHKLKMKKKSKKE